MLIPRTAQTPHKAPTSTTTPMEQEQEQEPKWGATVYADLPSATADDAWSLLSDFCGLHKWLPSLSSCRLLSGAEGVPGCVRHCVSTGEEPIWVNEELLDSDPAGRSYRYRITESNIGFREYVAKLGVVPASAGDGCRIEWSFQADPVKGWTEEGFAAYLRTGAEDIAGRIQEALKVAAAADQ